MITKLIVLCYLLYVLIYQPPLEIAVAMGFLIAMLHLIGWAIERIVSQK